MMHKEHKIPIAKVDATAESDLSKRFDVKGFPTIKLFIKGVEIDYKGERETEKMKEFILKKKEEPSEEVRES